MFFLLAILPEPDVDCMYNDSFKVIINYALKLMILTKLGAERRRLVLSLVIRNALTRHYTVGH